MEEEKQGILGLGHILNWFLKPGYSAVWFYLSVCGLLIVRRNTKLPRI